MRVLVTGGAGLIGSHTVDALRADGHEAVVLDALEPEVHPHGRPDWVPDDVEFHHADVRDRDACERALAGCDGLVHLAIYGGFSPEFSKMADVNVTGTTRLYEAVAAVGTVEAVVTASSMAVYGEGWYACPEHGPFHGTVRAEADRGDGRWEMPCPTCGAESAAHPIPADSDLQPHGTYACTKHFQERLTLTLADDLGVRATALRYFLTFGPRQSVFNPYSGICSIFSTRLLNDVPPVVYEDGRQTRDILYAGDVARANVLCLTDERAAGRVFNVARGESTAIADFARMLADAYDRDLAPEIPGRFRPMDTRHMLGDAADLRELGWTPEVSVRDGVGRYADWILEQGDVGEHFTEAERRLQELGIVREARLGSGS